MTTFVHLSDLHILSNHSEHSKSLDALEEALVSVNKTITEKGDHISLVVITGDIVDSPDRNWDADASVLKSCVGQIKRATNGARIVAVPGNHDRRKEGVFRADSAQALRAIREAGIDLFAPDGQDAHARQVPSPSEDWDLVAYDSTHMHFGLISAGGILRTDDLFALKLDASKKPLVVLMHHHLIPTPITDVGVISFEKSNQLFRHIGPWLAKNVVGGGEREELFMTALGAGSFLSALHALGRPVLVLHGHKHYPVIRHSSSTEVDDGDVLLSSAGSATVSERYDAAGTSVHLRPSFNVVRLTGHDVHIETHSYRPRESPKVVTAYGFDREDNRWKKTTADSLPPSHTSTSDTAHFQLERAHRPTGRRDMSCTRHVVSAASGWKEPVYLPKGAQLKVSGHEVKECEIDVESGTPVEYEATGAVCSTLDSLHRTYGEDSSPYEWLGLTVRHGSAVASLTVEGLTAAEIKSAFATKTDLRSGERRPLKLEIGQSRATATIENCHAQSFIQILWAPGE